MCCSVLGEGAVVRMQVTAMNKDGCELLEYKCVDELMGHGFVEDLVSQYGWDVMSEILNGALEGSATLCVGVQLINKSGNVVCVVVDVVPEVDEAGEVVSVVLEESSASDEMEQLVNGVSDVEVWFTNKIGDVVDCNKMAVEVLGYDKEDELLGEALVDDLMAEECRMQGHKVLKQVADERESFGDLSCCYCC